MAFNIKHLYMTIESEVHNKEDSTLLLTIAFIVFVHYIYIIYTTLNLNSHTYWNIPIMIVGNKTVIIADK